MPARYFDFRTDSLGAVPYRWAVLRFEFSGPFLLLFYEDSSGFRQNYSWPWTAADLAPLSNSPWGTTVQANIVNLAMGLPDARPGPHNTGPVPIAVFFNSPYGLEAQEYESQLWNSLAGIYDSHTQIIRLADNKPLRRSPLQLPIRILTADIDSWLTLQQLRSEWWCSDANISKFALQVDASGEDLESSLVESPAHIIVTHSALPVLEIAEGRPEASRPRLVIFLDQNLAAPMWYPVPRGVAFLRLTPDSFGQTTQNFIRSFVAGVIHDLPIHEAVKAAVRVENPPYTPRLVADPISNQSLRLSEALLQLKRETESFSLRLPAVLPYELFERVSTKREPEAIHLRDRVAAEFEEVRPLTGYVESRGWSFGRLSEFQSDSKHLPERVKGFSLESEGLIPMASMVQSLTEFRSIAVTAGQEAQRLSDNPETALLLRKHQERFVDVAMSRLETEPLFSALTHQQSLAVNTRYELRVHIGNPQLESLVTGERRPIDPLLPDTVDSRGHELDVSIQGKEFEVVSTTTQTLWLPEIGGSGPIYFDVRTPGTPASEAQLRICVYHRNHMVQSYLLTARVDLTEAYLSPGEQAIDVRLEFSRTERFANLDELRPRLLSIGANRSNGSTTHKLNVKADGVSEELTLFASTYDAEVKKFRAVLQAAAQDPINPAIPRTYPIVSPGQQPASDVADTFRTLARQGNDLFLALFRKASLASDDLRKSIERVQQASDEKLQVVCFDDNFVFPWSLLYDFLVPDRRKGIADPPICLGVAVDAAGNSVACSHSSKDRVFCVRGFWGVRHYIEEIIGNGTLLNPTVSRASRDPVRLVYDSNLAQSATLLKNLQNKLGASNVTVGPTDPDTLIDLLWDDPPKRPSILIVLAHLDTDDPVSVGEPEGERIVLEPQNKWLTRKMISEHIAPKWAQPRSIVLLMVCDSAAGGVEKVNTFVSAWDTAGAGAIVGTECIVGSQLAADFAEQLSVAMWKNSRTLGEATTSFRRQLTSQGNPLAFLFRAVGDIDLTVQ